MRVLIVGSFHRDANPAPSYEVQKARFDAACFALGAALAGREHTVMVGVPDWQMLKHRETAASFVIQGVSSAPPANSQVHTAIFYGPDDPEPPDRTSAVDSLRELRALPNVRLEDRLTGRGKYRAKTIPNVNAVDAVVLLSGTEGTASIGYAAYSMGKPVIALTSLKGAALEIYDDVLASDYRRFLGNAISEGDLRTLSVPWYGDDARQKDNLDSANAIVGVIEKFVKAYDADSKQGLGTLRATIGGLALMLLAWLGVYLHPNLVGQTTTFFLLLYLSALLGTGLRILTAYQDNRISRLTPQWLAIEGVVGLVVAFGLALMYLVGGISFTDTVVVLDPEHTAFATIAVSMALLGLAAGYLVPLNKLRERLEKIVTGEQK